MAKEDKVSVRIRMYRHGLGDCFLLTFMQEGKDDFNLMVDCGLLQGTTNGKEIMQRVVANIEETLPTSRTIDGETKKWLDVVVLTHEHADHISGFTQAREQFDRLHFGEVWAGWMDDEHHPKYNAVRKHFNKQVTGLQAALTKMTPDSPQGLKEETLQQKGLRETVHALLHDFFDDDALGAAKKNGGRSPSWTYALDKSVNNPRFLSPNAVFNIDGLEGVRFYVLGPPEDFTTFTQVDPPQDETYRSESKNNFALADSFFAAAAGAADDDNLFDAGLYQPFEEHLRIDKKDAPKLDFFNDNYGFQAKEANEWRRIDNDWLNAAGGLALNLDTYTNNTCLALAIEFIESGRILLFPGDAQFANWISWQKLDFEVTENDGTKRRVKIKELLEQTILYKVGHHGSHNATLKTHGLELMSNPELMAIIPVDREKAKSKTSKTNKNGWEMPEKVLFQRLLERTRGRVVLADEGDKSALKDRCQDNKFIEKIGFGGDSLKDLKSSAKEEPLYVEFIIK